MIQQEIVQEAINRLVRAYSPLEIYIFGKYGWGTPDEDDDLNLLVIVAESNEKVYKRGDRAFDTLLSLAIPKNVVIFTQQEFDRSCQDKTSLAYEVKSRGKKAYARG